MEGRSSKEFNWSGCFIVLLIFVVDLIWGGIIKGLGVLLQTLRDQFSSHTWLIGIMAAAFGVTIDAAGIFIVPLETRFKGRHVLILSASLAGISLLLVPFASSIPQIFLLLVVLAGPSIGVVNVLGKVYIGRHFTKYYALACGFVQVGSAASIVIFAPLTQLFLDTYGWRGAMLLIGALCFNLVPCAAVVSVDESKYKSLPVQNGDDPSKPTESESWKTLCAQLLRDMDLGMLLEFNFIATLLSWTNCIVTFTSWVTYYIPHLEVKGISPEVAATLSSAGAVGYFLGTIMCAPFIDRGILTCPSAIVITNAILAPSFLVDPWVDDVIGQAIITFICCLCMSATCTLNDVLVKDLFGVERLNSAFGMIGLLNSAPRILSGFIPGWIYDASGTYDLAFIILGTVPIITTIPLVIGKAMKRF